MSSNCMKPFSECASLWIFLELQGAKTAVNVILLSHSDTASFQHHNTHN